MMPVSLLQVDIGRKDKLHSVSSGAECSAEGQIKMMQTSFVENDVGLQCEIDSRRQGQYCQIQTGHEREDSSWIAMQYLVFDVQRVLR